MKKILLPIILAAIPLLILIGCSSKSAKKPDNLTGQETNSISTTSTQEKNFINIKDFKFDPEIIDINKGETVTWKNEDSAAHTITSKEFDSGNLKQGDTFKQIFNKTGTFEYYCSNHTSMKGTVRVK